MTRPIMVWDHVVTKSADSEWAGVSGEVVEIDGEAAKVAFDVDNPVWIWLRDIMHFLDRYTLEIGDEVRITAGAHEGKIGKIRSIDNADARLPYYIVTPGANMWFSADDVEPLEPLDEIVAEAIESITETARSRHV